MAVMDYLPPATVDKWIKEKVLLAPTATSCAMPKGIFAEPGEQGGGGMLRMVAFGPESHQTWPPRPADPKARWEPEWTVRVRTQSTTGAILGMTRRRPTSPIASRPAPARSCCCASTTRAAR